MNTVVIDFGSISDTISKDQFCKICHMSKRTAGKYLGTVIPCGDNGKKTHRYTITKADLIAFLERYPERQKYQYFPRFVDVLRLLSAQCHFQIMLGTL